MSSGEGGSVDPGWRSGRSPATRDRLRECNVPHTVPLCNTNNVICPTRLESGHPSDPNWARLRGLRGLGGFMRGTGAPAGRVALRLFARRLAGYRGTDVALWARVGYARISQSQPQEGSAANASCRLARRALSTRRAGGRLWRRRGLRGGGPGVGG